MSQFNAYARRLDAAFKKARQGQRDAAATLADAENALNSFDRHQPEDVCGMNDAKLRVLQGAAKKARSTYNRVLQDGWYDFVRERNTIQRELQEAIHKSYGALPEQVDQSTIALIQSGILDAAETSGLFRRFEAENNVAMMRIVGKYASERAEKTDDLQQRAVFLSVAQDAADSKGATLKSWGSLCDFAAECLGRRDDLGTITPSAAATMWEESAGPVIESF